MISLSSNICLWSFWKQELKWRILDLVKVQSPSALLKGNVLSALWSHCLVIVLPVMLVPKLPVKTRHYNMKQGEKVYYSLLRSSVIQFPLCNAKTMSHYYKEWSIKSVGANLQSHWKAGSWSQQAWMWGFKCRVLTLWGFTTYSSTNENYSVWFVQNIGLNQRYTIKIGVSMQDLTPSGKTTVETADSAIYLKLQPWRGHSNISIMEECNDLNKRPLCAGHIQASFFFLFFAHDGDSAKDNVSMLRTFLLIR